MPRVPLTLMVPGVTLRGTTEDKWVEAATKLGEVIVMCGVVECCRGATLSREDGRKAGACAFSK